MQHMPRAACFAKCSTTANGAPSAPLPFRPAHTTITTINPLSLAAGCSTIACFNPGLEIGQYPSNNTDSGSYFHSYSSCCCAYPYLSGPLIDDLARLE